MVLLREVGDYIRRAELDARLQAPLAISDDSQFLYVGMGGTSSVQRVTLPGLVPDISYSLPRDSNGGPYFALDLQVAPGAPNTTAVSKGTMILQPTGGISVYDDSTPGPTSVQGFGPTFDSYDSIQWGSDATKLYGATVQPRASTFTRWM
jgi:hypothetical protein